MSATSHKSWLAGIAVAAGVGAAAAAGQGVATAETGSTGDGPSSSASGSSDGSSGSTSASDGSTTGKDTSAAANATPQSKVDATGGSKKKLTPTESEEQDAADADGSTSHTARSASNRNATEGGETDVDADTASDDDGADRSITSVATLSATVNASPTTDPNPSSGSDSSARRFASDDSTPQTPVTPAPSPLELAGAFLRRQIVHTLFNNTPTATPTVDPETEDGVITGSVGATDPDGDPLRYKVTGDPLHGKVVVDSDGTFTYTPSSDPAVKDLPDFFTVTVDDSAGSQLPGLLGIVQSIVHAGAQILGFAKPDTTEVMVPVNFVLGSGPSVAVGQQPVAAVAKPGTSRIYVVNQGDNTVSVVDVTDDPAVIKTIPVGHAPTALAINPQGTNVYVLNPSDNSMSIIDTETNSVTATVGGLEHAGSVAANANTVYVTNTETNSVYAIDALTKSTSTFSVGAKPIAIALSPNGNTLYVARGNGTDGYSVAAIDTATKTVSKSLKLDVVPVAMAIKPDGTRLYVMPTTSGAGVPVIDTSSMTQNSKLNVIVFGSGTPSSITVTSTGTVLMTIRGADLAVAGSSRDLVPLGPRNGRDQTGVVALSAGRGSAYVLDHSDNRLLRLV